MLLKEQDTKAQESGGSDSMIPPTPSTRWKLAGDKVLAGTSKYRDDERTLLRWCAAWGRQKNLTVEEVAAALKKPNGEAYSYDSLYQALIGAREVDQVGPICAAIAKLRAVEQPRAEMTSADFIETSLTRRLFKSFRMAFLRKKVLMIIARSQSGKTRISQEYAKRHNHGETVYLRLPVLASLSSTLSELCRVLGIPESIKDIPTKRRRILESFDERMLLIVDEAQECFAGARRNSGLSTLNFLREIHDRRGCGLVLLGDPYFKKELFFGSAADQCTRIRLRGLAPVTVPDMPSLQDLAAFASAYGLDPAPSESSEYVFQVENEEGELVRAKWETSPLQLQSLIVRTFGLGRWNVILQEASDMARERRKPIHWGHVVAAAWQHEDCRDLREGGAK